MSRPRLSLGGLMAVVVAVAVNLAVVRLALQLEGSDPVACLIALGTLLPGDAVALAGARAVRRRRRRREWPRFWVGFVAAGLVAMLGFVAASYSQFALVAGAIEQCGTPLLWALRRVGIDPNSPAAAGSEALLYGVFVPWTLLLLGAPQLVFAWLGGCMLSHYQLIRRRPAPTAEPLAWPRRLDPRRRAETARRRYPGLTT